MMKISSKGKCPRIFGRPTSFLLAISDYVGDNIHLLAISFGAANRSLGTWKLLLACQKRLALQDDTWSLCWYVYLTANIYTYHLLVGQASGLYYVLLGKPSIVKLMKDHLLGFNSVSNRELSSINCNEQWSDWGVNYMTKEWAPERCNIF